MNAKDAARHIVTLSGQSHRAIAAEMGKSAAYVSVMLSKDVVPKADTLAELARACGYTLQLVPDDGTDTIIIDAPTDKE